MPILENTIKSTLLAASIFWLFYIDHIYPSRIITYVLISFLPIFICCLMTIAASIYPFFFIGGTSKIARQKTFTIYFPYYVMIAFSFSGVLLISTRFDPFILSFITSAFITTSQSWVWFAKQ